MTIASMRCTTLPKGSTEITMNVAVPLMRPRWTSCGVKLGTGAEGADPLGEIGEGEWFGHIVGGAEPESRCPGIV